MACQQGRLAERMAKPMGRSAAQFFRASRIGLLDVGCDLLKSIGHKFIESLPGTDRLKSLEIAAVFRCRDCLAAGADLAMSA